MRFRRHFPDATARDRRVVRRSVTAGGRASTLRVMRWNRTLKSALALALAVNVVFACGDDDETSNPGSGGSAGKGGSGGAATAGTNGSGAVAGQGGEPQSGAGAAGGSDSSAGGTGGSEPTGSDGGVAGFSDQPGGGGEGGGDSEPNVPLDGFGEIAGDCGVIDQASLDSASPAIFRASFTFPGEDYMISDLSVGGVELSVANAQGSSLDSEVFAYEYLYRCELAEMLKTEDEIQYDDADGKKVDVLVGLHGEDLGVSVTRAVKFPFNEPYTVVDAEDLLEQKLEDLVLSTANVTDTWKKPVLVVMAYSDVHADAVKEAYESIDAATKANIIVFVVVTEGDDDFMYE
jgi:hypothetical protein